VNVRVTAPLTAERAQALLTREAHLLDVRRWEDWLAMYATEAVFWVPSWRDDGTPIEDPDREVSFIYHETRAALEDRVWRLESGRSAASNPILRTAHAVTGAVLEGDPTASASSPTVFASWTCHVYDPKQRKQHVFFGRYEMTYKADGEDWRIARKKIVLLNDYIPTMIDFYCI
jgi:3-phenylpropionate/cinnamic acid dioxygenase small subunit